MSSRAATNGFKVSKVLAYIFPFCKDNASAIFWGASRSLAQIKSKIECCSISQSRFVDGENVLLLESG